ncbi:hypothetical protein [Xenorhabdus sp. Sc-CR9]|uniref:hypothetical protein n=1 Tax=Xenorhabdus sp. Sc-CR9 TaxID=2584468 RepID=UPI001F4087C6|nr:hypothetical protein [Xenorhabdus sp. Sc-CR9]
MGFLHSSSPDLTHTPNGRLRAVHRGMKAAFSMTAIPSASWSIPTRCARLLPRLARTQKGRVFVQLCRGGETLPLLGLCGIGISRKTVQVCDEL